MLLVIFDSFNQRAAFPLAILQKRALSENSRKSVKLCFFFPRQLGTWTACIQAGISTFLSLEYYHNRCLLYKTSDNEPKLYFEE